MKNRLYLIWNSFKTNEYLILGYLEKYENKYCFQCTKDALKAQELGCFLPFEYSESIIVMDSLPLFFKARITDQERNNVKSNIDDFVVLANTKGVKNSDNFLTVSEEDLPSMLQKKNNL